MARQPLPSNTEVLVALLQDAQQFIQAMAPLVHQFRMQDHVLKLAIEDPDEFARQSAFVAQLHRAIYKNIAASALIMSTCWTTSTSISLQLPASSTP